ncbi:MAG: hypothetical protein EBZ48_04505 [Proteobacteria bacterium]|nr:hypothetical protein [Pseudomonadota bacterium]
MFIDPHNAPPNPDSNPDSGSGSARPPKGRDSSSPTPFSPDLFLKASYVEVAPEGGVMSNLLRTHLHQQSGMAIASLDTGSSGNSTIFLGMEPDGRGEMLAIDCGLSRSKVREHLAELGLHHSCAAVSLHQLRELRAGAKAIWFEHLLVTHLHSDHFTESTARFCRDAGITVHIDPAAVAELQSRASQSNTAAKLCAAIRELKEANLFAPFPPGTSKELGSWVVHSTSALHDVPANAYTVSYKSMTAFHSGDTGAYTPQMRAMAERSQVVLSDGNYDISLIDSVNRDPSVNERTKGPLGHLGNHQNAELLRSISRGACSGTIQAQILLHRSDSSNRRELSAITTALQEAWDAHAAGRYAPAVRVAERGPRLLCALSEDRHLILPQGGASQGLLSMQFGETGLSDLVGRDLMPELIREHRARADTYKKLVSADDLRARSKGDSALVQWRVPGEIALVRTTQPERTKELAQIVISRSISDGCVRIAINNTELNSDRNRALLCRELTRVLRPRIPECMGKLFHADQSNTVVSSMPLPESLLTEIAKVTELILCNGVTRDHLPAEETRVRWMAGGKIAVVITDHVPFERSGLAEIVVMYNRELHGLLVEVYGDRATRKYLHPDCCTGLINALDQFIATLPDQRKKGGISWSIRRDDTGAGKVKHSGAVELNEHEIEALSALIERQLFWL